MYENVKKGPITLISCLHGSMVLQHDGDGNDLTVVEDSDLHHDSAGVKELEKPVWFLHEVRGIFLLCVDVMLTR